MIFESKVRNTKEHQMSASSAETPIEDNRDFRIISTFLYDPRLPALIRQYGGDHYPEPRDSPYYLIKYQRDRMFTAANTFKWEKVIAFLRHDLDHLLKIIDSDIPDREEAWRVSFHLDADGRSFMSTEPLDLSSPLEFHFPCSFNTFPRETDTKPWSLFIDSQPTVPSAFTTYKTTIRDHYNAAMKRAGIGSIHDVKSSEVLLLNLDGEVIEGSRTTPYFQRRQMRAVSSDAKEARNAEPAWVTPPLSCGGNASTTRRFALESGLCVEEVVLVEELVNGERCWLSNAVRGFVAAIVVIQSNRAL